MENIHENLVCPITRELFRNPVTLQDGITYEFQAIQEWLKNHVTSPITGEKVVLHNKINIIVKNIVDIYEKQNNDDTITRYPFYSNLLTFNKAQFIKLEHISDQKDYLEKVDLECETSDGLRPIHFLCRYSTPEMIRYIIDKGVDLECETSDRWRPIHFLLYNSNATPEIIRYISSKNVRLTLYDKIRYYYKIYCK